MGKGAVAQYGDQMPQSQQLAQNINNISEGIFSRHKDTVRLQNCMADNTDERIQKTSQSKNGQSKKQQQLSPAWSYKNS